MSITYTVNARLDETILVTRAGETLVDRLDNDNLAVRGALTDITADVIQNSVDWTKGIPGKGPQDRIATTGSLNLSVKNGLNNSTGLLGAYSPDNTNCRLGWTIGAGLQLIETDGTTSKYTYWRISEIEPEMGLYGSRKVNVRAVDFIDQLSSQQIDSLAVQINKMGDFIIGYVLNSMAITPMARSIGTSTYTFPAALDATEKDESSTPYSVVNKVVMSDMGMFYSPADTTYGELVKYESYGAWTGKSTSGTFTDNMQGLKVVRNAEKVYNDVRMTVYPRRIDTTDGTLCQLDYEMTMAAAATANLNLRYIDQNSAVRVAAYNTQTQVAGTDYKFSSVSGNGGSNLNASLGITLDLTSGNTLNAIVSNNGTVTGYLNLFQLRGKAIKTYTQIESIASDNSSIAQFGRKTLRYSMPYQSDPIAAQSFANIFLASYKQPSTDVDGLKYITSTSDLESKAMTLNVGDKITLNETVTGLTSKNFYIAQESHRLDLNYANVEYGLIPA
jgi:hypothetical protein